jgi:hypothetical protein
VSDRRPIHGNRRFAASSGGGGPAPPSFDPTVYANLKLNLDGDTNVVTSGGGVTTWTGGSGGALVFTDQSNASQRPTIGSSYNGHGSVRFNGTTQFLQSASLLSNLISASAFSLYLVVKPISFVHAGSYGSFALIDTVVGDSNDYMVGGFDSSNGGESSIAVYDGSYKKVRIVTGNALQILSLRLGSGTLRASINGGADSTTATGNVQNLTNVVQLGRGTSSGSSFANVDLAAAYAYSSDHTGSNDSAIISALRAKYGI